MSLLTVQCFLVANISQPTDIRIFWRQASYRLSMYERSGSPFTMLLTILSCSNSSLAWWFPRGGSAATELMKPTVFGSTFAVGARAGIGFDGDSGAGVE